MAKKMDIQLALKAKLDRKLMRVLKRSLELEVRHLPKKKYSGTIKTVGDTISISLRIKELSALRAIINSYTRYISVVYHVITRLNLGLNFINKEKGTSSGGEFLERGNRASTSSSRAVG